MLEYVPETVYRVARHFTKAKLIIPIIYVKVGRQAAGAQAQNQGSGATCVYGFSRLPRWSLEAYVPHPQLCSLQVGLAKPRPRGWKRNCSIQ